MEDDDSSSEVETTLSDDEDEDEGAWLEPSHRGGNLPAVVRRRLVPTVSRVGSCSVVLCRGNGQGGFGQFVFEY